MNLWLKLLLIGFLLWDQNNFASGQDSGITNKTGTTLPTPQSNLNTTNLSNDNSSRTADTQNETQSEGDHSDLQAPIPTVSLETPKLADNSTAVFDTLTPPVRNTMNSSSGLTPISSGTTNSQTHAPNSTIVSRAEIKPTVTSSAVLTPFTANSTTSQYPATGVSNSTGMQAPTLTPNMDLTSAFTGTTGPSSSDFHQPTSPTTAVSPSTQGGSESRVDCSAISIKKPSYKTPNEILTLENSDEIKNSTLTCNYTMPSISGNSFTNFTLCNYTFNVLQCTKLQIMCTFQECRNEFPVKLNVPPSKGSYNANFTVEKDSITFVWSNFNGSNCSVQVNTTCTHGNETFKNRGEPEVKELKPYTNYSCTSQLLYDGDIIVEQSENIRTKIGTPGKVASLQSNVINTTIEITWGMPQTRNGPLTGFILYLGLHEGHFVQLTGWGFYNVVQQPQAYNILPQILTQINSNNRDPVNIPNTYTNSYKFESLDPFTTYIVNVRAYNTENNVELEGDPVSKAIRTEEGIPTQVMIVHVFVGPDHNNAITIHCKEPSRINGEKGQYKLILNNEIKKNSDHCKFYIKDLSYLTSYNYEIFYQNNRYSGIKTTGHIRTKYNDKALIGFLAFLISITTLALLIVLFKIYKLKKKSSSNHEDNVSLIVRENFGVKSAEVKERDVTKKVDLVAMASTLDNIFAEISQDDENQLLNIEPILVEQLLETYKRKNADEGRLFLDEFQSIPRVFSKFAIKEARMPCNQPKNRYIDILPYDDNRVVLSEIHGEPGSNYINASYINGFKEPRKYIAAQGPKEETMNDFWRMIWEQKSTIIVMVTRCEEGNRNKCVQYWPSMEAETEQFGDIVVKITEEKFFPDYITRKLHITSKREKSGRDITHIQFTVWPDHGVPDDPNLLLKLRRRVNALSNFFSGPIIVHCSAGVGRTGTYISIDAMLEGLEAEGRVDVYGYVVQLRRQRCLMVQVESQYIFIHKSLVEYNQYGETEVSLPELPLLLNNLKKMDPPSEPSQLKCEFQRLPSYKNWRPQTTGNHQDNKDKNRNLSIVPYEFNRVHIKADNNEPETEHVEDSELSTDEDSDSEDSSYINASYIIGYWGTQGLIAAQSPLTNTVCEFWQMIFQRKIKAIVMLSSPIQENNEDACAPYWKEKNKTYDDLEIELTNEKSCGSYIERCFEIRRSKRKDVRKVSQFHYGHWEGDLPKETKELLEMIEKIRKHFPSRATEEHSRHDKSAHLLVHCSDGSQLTGTFCALWNIIESAHVEGVIDVSQTVKNLRRQRLGMVSSFEQYEFLYDTIASTVPAQNGQVKSSIHQEDKLEIENELENKVREVKDSASSGEDTSPKPKEDETISNGPSPDVTLRIDE